MGYEQILPPGCDRTDRPRWLAARRSGIGSSDVSAILGLGKYKTAFSVYMEKITDEDEEAGEAAHWGTLFEPVVRDEWTRRTEITTTPVGMLRSSVHKFMLYSPDGLTSDGGLYEGKSLDVATPMLTTRGWTTMGELREGDEVFHPDGRPVRVTAAHPIRRHRRCYRVVTADGRSVVADAEHLWTVQDMRAHHGTRATNAPWVTLSTEQIVGRGLRTTTGQTRWRLPRQERVESADVELPLDPYLLGVWLGDGFTANARITVGDEDIAEMQENLHAVGVQTSAARYRTAWAVRVHGIPFARLCRDLGVWERKHVPDVYLAAGTDQRLALLQGLLDTDGTISRRGQVEFCACRRDLAEAVLYLARSLGWRANVHVGKSQLYGREMQPRWRVRFTPTAADLIPFRLARKVARVQPRTSQTREGRQFRIESIVPVETRPVRCIRVDREDGLFLAGRDLLPTHNTTTAWLREDWADGQVPDHAELQVQHGMAVTGLGHAYVAGLIGGQRLAWQRIERDEGLISEIVEAERRFWYGYVLAEVPPPFGGTDRETEWLTHHHPLADLGATVQVTAAEATRLRRALREADALRRVGKDGEAAYKAAQNQLRALLGDAETLLCGKEVIATWRHTGSAFDDDRFRAEQPELAARYLRTVEEIDKTALADEHPDVYRKYRNRVLNVKKTREN